MATKQRSRGSSRRSSPRDRGPRYVAPVLDPTWQSPYAPSVAEREANANAVRRFALRRRTPQLVVLSVVSLALITGVVVSPWLALVGVVVAALGAYDTVRYLTNFERRGTTLGAELTDSFKAGGTTKDRQRLVTVLDRLAATFGVDGISAFIVDEQGYNAALVPNGSSLALFVTAGLMKDFELIEFEGVVAHCLARHRLGLLSRQSLASTLPLRSDAQAALAGPGSAYRADEVAAAAIRYPLGLAGALHKCARQSLSTESYFASAKYGKTRYSWFNMYADAKVSDLSNLDDVELRAMALEEW